MNNKLDFRLSIRFEFEPAVSGGEIIFHMKGVVQIGLKGERFSYNFPKVINKGMIAGSKRMNMEGTVFFYYFDKNYKAYVDFGKPDKNELSGMICISDNVLSKIPNVMGSNIFKDVKKIKQSDDQIMSKISGCWFRQILFDGKEYWNSTQKSYSLHVNENVLPSDYRFREDLIWHINGNLEQALQWKYKLEEVQRRHQKRREAYMKKLKKKK